MNKIQQTTGKLWALVDDLHVAIALDRDEDVHPLLERLEETMGEIERELVDEQRARIVSLAEECVCGRDRGEHLVVPPHASDEDEEPNGLPPCSGFHARATEPYLPRYEPTTEPPPPPTAEAS